jgi:hypothetical protein
VPSARTYAKPRSIAATIPPDVRGRNAAATVPMWRRLTLAGHHVHCTDIASEHIDESKLGSVCEPNWPFPMLGVRIDDLFGGCHGCAWRLGLVTVSVNREQNISRAQGWTATADASSRELWDTTP